jgi:hypothetical protein
MGEGLADGDGESGWVGTVADGVAKDLSQHGQVAGDDGGAGGDGLHRGQPEAFFG